MIIGIILNEEQRTSVKGTYGKYSGLDPVQLADGSYFLPVEVLTNNDLPEGIIAILEQLPQRVLNDEDFIQGEQI